MERRRFHRVNFSSPAALVHNEIIYLVRLENICLRGALISSTECDSTAAGENCSLLISTEDSEEPIVASGRIAYALFSMVGVRFDSFSGDGESRLYRLMEKITDNPDRLREEWEGLVAERGEAQCVPPSP